MGNLPVNWYKLCCSFPIYFTNCVMCWPMTVAYDYHMLCLECLSTSLPVQKKKAAIMTQDCDCYYLFISWIY